MKKLLKIFTVGVLSASILAGCGSSSSTGEQVTITMNGSTSMEKLSNSLAEVYMEANPNIIISPQFTGSSAGVEAVINNSVDIGNSSRALKEEEKEKGVVENIVAIDGMAVITDPANEVSDLTLEQLVSIFDGTITNWNEVGGKDMGIVVIGRESGSGTRGAFEEILDIKDKCKYAQEIDSTGAVVGKVESTPGSIGYVSLDVIHNSTAKALKLEGVEPTAENIISGDYTLSRPFVMATSGEISEQKQEIQDFFKFIEGEKGKEIVEKVGLISVN